MKKNYGVFVLMLYVLYSPVRVFAYPPYADPHFDASESLFTGGYKNDSSGKKVCVVLDSLWIGQVNSVDVFGCVDKKRFIEGEGRVCHMDSVGDYTCGCTDSNMVYATVWKGKDIWGCIDNPISDTKKDEKPEINLAPPPSENTPPQKDGIIIPTDNNIGNGGEVTLDKYGNFLEGIKNDRVKDDYRNSLQAWDESLSDAENKGQFKEGVDKDAFLKKAEREKEEKNQISDVAIDIGYYHKRNAEISGIAKYELLSKDPEYKKRFPQPSQDHDKFEGPNNSNNPEEFKRISDGIKGGMENIKKLEKAFNNSYPFGWKTDFLAVAPKPTEEAQAKKTGDFWDITLKDKLNK